MVGEKSPLPPICLHMRLRSGEHHPSAWGGPLVPGRSDDAGRTNENFRIIAKLLASPIVPVAMFLAAQADRPHRR